MSRIFFNLIYRLESQSCHTSCFSSCQWAPIHCVYYNRWAFTILLCLQTEETVQVLKEAIIDIKVASDTHFIHAAILLEGELLTLLSELLAHVVMGTQYSQVNGKEVEVFFFISNLYTVKWETRANKLCPYIFSCETVSTDIKINSLWLYIDFKFHWFLTHPPTCTVAVQI